MRVTGQVDFRRRHGLHRWKTMHGQIEHKVRQYQARRKNSHTTPSIRAGRCVSKYQIHPHKDQVRFDNSHTPKEVCHEFRISSCHYNGIQPVFLLLMPQALSCRGPDPGDSVVDAFGCCATGYRRAKITLSPVNPGGISPQGLSHHIRAGEDITAQMLPLGVHIVDRHSRARINNNGAPG